MGTTAAVAAGLSLLATDGRAGEVLTPARVFASPDLSGPTARGVQMAPDGSAVTYLKSKPSDVTITDLWIADVAGGSSRLLIDGAALSPKDHTLSEAEKSRREREGVQTHGVVDYAWDDEGRFIVVPVEGHLWLFVRESGAVRQLTNTPASDIDAKVSPKGGYVSFIRDDNLYIVPTAGGPERALTQGGTELRSWGTAEFIAQEEFDRPTGYWWSPDETRIALTLVDQSDVDVIERPEIGATGATVVRQRYPRAGRRNAQVELYIEDLATLTRTRVNLGSSSDIYIPRVDWSKDGRILYVQRLSRDQRHLEVLAVDPTNGTARVILAESSPHWVEVTSDFTPLHDGRFLWTSERSGYRHLYLYSGSG
ncbi:MAG TPA: DPP IV N-terminal domain-containing protein, partial [Steroidobacteraceae bacterium]|nr:DPP IV N-terminal domain-containing protein [Steroidobacteraceae bacterium]